MIKLLFKIQLISAYKQIFRLGNKKTKKASPVKIILISLLAFYVIASVMFSVGAMFSTLAKGLVYAGLGWVYFANIGLFTFGMTVVFNIFMSQSMLFEAKDNNILLSLPIKPSHILGSRVLVLGVIEYLLSMLFLLPAVAVYVYFASPSFWFYIIFIIASILITLVGITVVTLLGYIISLITSRMRNKSILCTLISVAMAALYLWGYYSLTGNMAVLIEKGASIGDAIRTALPLFYHFGMALDKTNIISLVFFGLWCIIPFTLIYFWLSKSFISLVTTNRQAKKLIYRDSKLESQSIFKALFKKELKKLVSSPIYLLNCGIGFVINIAFGVYFFINGADMFAQLEIPQISMLTVPITLAVLCFIAAMSGTTAPSVSLEGKNLWILKSSPIKVSDIFKAKISLNLVLGITTLIFADICIIIKLQPSFFDALIIVLVPISIQIFTAIEGLTCNLFFPKFDAVNEAMVVKQSMSVLVAMIISFAVLAIIIVTYILLIIPFEIPLVYFGLGIFVAINILNVIAYRFIMNRGIEIFNAF